VSYPEDLEPPQTNLYTETSHKNNMTKTFYNLNANEKTA